MKYNFLRFPQGKRKCVTFSFDDGSKFDIKLAEIMNKNGIKGTFNYCSHYVLDETETYFLSADQIKKHILAAGHEVAIHGDKHRAPGLTNSCLAIQDFLNCRLKLEEALGIIIKGMAYPDAGIRRMNGNNTYESIRSYLKSLGVVYARTLGGDNTSFYLPNDFLAWMPTAHTKNPELLKMIDTFIEKDDSYSGSRDPMLFYLWGHSTEFENDIGWQLCEEICEKLGNRNDFWYATNMEIYNYVKGYNSLVYSADCKTIYNPNLFDIWFEVDKELFCVKSGETIRLEIKNEL